MMDKEELNDLYWGKGMSLKEISKVAGVHPATVLYWMAKYGTPKKARSDIESLKWAKRLGVKRVNLNSTKELSYFIGALRGDGWLEKGTWRLGFKAKDRDFVDEFIRCLSEILEGRSIKANFSENIWKVRVSNKELYFFLSDRERCAQVIEKFPSDFLRGIFDAEGGVYPSSKGCRVCMWNTDSSIIELVRNSLERLSIAYCVVLITRLGVGGIVNGRKIIRRKPVFVVKLSGIESLVKFSQLVGFSIGRKQQRLAGAVRRHEERSRAEQRIDSLVPKMRKLREMGYYYRDIAKVVGVPKSTVHLRLSEEAFV